MLNYSAKIHLFFQIQQKIKKNAGSAWSDCNSYRTKDFDIWIAFTLLCSWQTCSSTQRREASQYHEVIKRFPSGMESWFYEYRGGK